MIPRKGGGEASRCALVNWIVVTCPRLWWSVSECGCFGVGLYVSLCLCQWGAVPGLQSPYGPLSVWGRLYLSSRDSSGFAVCLPAPDDPVCGWPSAFSSVGWRLWVCPSVCHGDSVCVRGAEVTSLRLSGGGVEQQKLPLRHWLVRFMATSSPHRI